MKRIFSIIVACVMLVSCFAVMSVSAAEPTSWTLPTDWSTGKVEQVQGWDFPKQGNWQLLGFSDLDTATATTNPNVVAYSEMTSFNNTQTPYPYMGTDHNETKAQGKEVKDYYTATNWYTNYNKRWGGMTFSPLKDSSGLYVTSNANKDCAIVFTAPKAGTYSYTELVTALIFETSETKEAVSYEVTVRKNGTVLDTFVPTAAAPSKTISGTVELAVGDLLMFAFEQTTEIEFTAKNANNPNGNHSQNDPRCLSVTGLVVKEVVNTGNEGNQGTTPSDPGPWSLPMNWTNTGVFDDNGWELAVQGQWKLTSFADLSDITTIRNGASSAALGAGVNSKSPKSYLESAKNRAAASAITVPADWSGWYVNYQYRWFSSTLGSNRSVAFANGDGSTYMKVTPMGTTDTNNPTVVFTAPADGKYDYSTIITGAVFTDENDAAVATTATVRVNGVVVNTFAPTAANPTKTLTGTVELKAGDLLMFAFELTTTGNDITDYTEIIKLGTTTVALSTNAGTGNEGSGSDSNNPNTGAISVIAFVGAAVVATATGKAVASKRRRNG